MSELDKIKTYLEKADAVVIGAGAGLSTSAGFTYSGERFEKYFSDFRERYGFSDMYTGGFYSYKTLEEHWAYWSRYIMINRYMNAPVPVYETLFEIVKDRNYFVITTNVDHCFQKAGFDKSRLFYTQGDYGLFQCSEPCHPKTYDNEESVRAMCENQHDMKIPTELLPKCPVCGKPMSMNLRSDDTFVEDEGWHEASLRYQDFLNENKDKNIVYLELGVGGNTPGIIKYPFWNMTYSNRKSKYICINKGEAVVPKEIEEQSICVNNDIYEVIKSL